MPQQIDKSSLIYNTYGDEGDQLKVKESTPRCLSMSVSMITWWPVTSNLVAALTSLFSIGKS